MAAYCNWNGAVNSTPQYYWNEESCKISENINLCNCGSRIMHWLQELHIRGNVSNLQNQLLIGDTNGEIIQKYCKGRYNDAFFSFLDLMLYHRQLKKLMFL